MTGALISAFPPHRSTDGMRRIAVITLLVAVVLAPDATAQRVTIGFGPPPRSTSAFVSPIPVLGFPWFADYSPVRPPQTPPVVVVQTQPAPAETKEEIKPASPLLIEWRGNRFVRFRGDEVGASTSPDYVQAPPPSKPAALAQPLPSAVLVFRDGHREEAPEYTIFQGTLYSRGDYWLNGYWTKKIPLSLLDLPATVRANQGRGVKFTLPSAPNEVVTRP